MNDDQREMLELRQECTRLRVENLLQRRNLDRKDGKIQELETRLEAVRLAVFGPVSEAMRAEVAP